MVFPTELALRRYQQEQALEHGWVDASGHTTFSRLRKLCLPYARLKGRYLDAAQQLLMRNQVVELAQGHFDGQGTLGELSDAALCEVLDQLITEMAALPSESTRIVDWMLDESRSIKLRQLGTLYSIWRTVLKQEGFADALDVNLAILKLLSGKRHEWPPLLRNARKIIFRSVRWFNPLEEACVAALNHRMQVCVETALPSAHAESSADRLGQRIRAEVMTAPWAMWAEDLGDALAVDSPDLVLLENVDRIDFSRSSGAYGEIEDLARRICWNLQESGLTANRIALVVPDIGRVQDIIPHVFGRFRIPYYFRRGRPVLSSPCVKGYLAWLAFPLNPERDALIDLVRNPAIRFDNREETVDQLLKAPPRIDSGRFSFFQGMDEVSGKQASVILEDRIIAPDDHFNAEALKTVGAALENIGDQRLPLRVLVDLLEELLENATVKPRDSHEQGVWILNPHDAVGLAFDLVLFAGLNEGEFPAIPQQDALFSDGERQTLRNTLGQQGGHLPALALPKAEVLIEQQSVLFLTVLGMARRQLILSYQSVDQEGNDKNESEFFRKLWNLAGWCVQDEIIPGPYDRWRIEQLDPGSIFAGHLAKQQQIPAEDRIPMPGESFLTIVPLPLCRAQDEALQAAVGGGTGSVPSIRSAALDDTYLRPEKQVVVPPTSLEHLLAMLHVEAERDAYLDAPIDERSSSAYCGHIASLKKQVAAWFDDGRELSPTALEKLARCRYVFLLEQVFGLEDDRLADDTPDPLDRGSLIHSILKEIYAAIATGEAGIDAPRQWAVKAEAGWIRRTEGGVDSIPLAVFLPGREDEYIAFARTLAHGCMDRAELGHPGVWAAEREKIMEQILNVVRYDVRHCEEEHRFPALFENLFGGESAVDLGEVRLKGKIDRVDLIFADKGVLEKVRVLDYKGSSRALKSKEDYLDDIRRNLDCQLPIYAFAAQHRFFGECNTAVSNVHTETGYLFYERDLSDTVRKSKKSLVPMDEPGLVDDFLATLFKNLRLLKEGDFSVDPLIASYNDYESICRSTAIDREDME